MPQSSDEDASSIGKQSRLSKIGSKIKSKTKHSIARTVGHILDDDRYEDDSVANTLENAAFQPASVETPVVSGNGPLDKAKSAARSTGSFLSHPRKTVQAKAKQIAAGKISSVHQSQSLPLQNSSLLQAHDDYHDIDSQSSDVNPLETNASDGAGGTSKFNQEAHLKDLELQQESMQVAWVTQRIGRVKAVASRVIDYPDRKDFYFKGKDGKQKFDLLRWIGVLALWYTQDFTSQYVDDFETPPFDVATTRKHVERLVMATAPWQVWAMDVRSIYRWDNPKRTGRWFVLWMFIWYFEYMGSFFWASIIFYTIRSKLNPSPLRHLRASIQRSTDREKAASEFGEFINRHGGDDWIDPLIQRLGPVLQLQLNDLADFVEITANFYSWRSPRYTLATLLLFTSCLAIALLTELRYAMKIFWFLCGGGFFLCWPIASLYPQYRLLVSPLRWMLWDIPTQAEWSMNYLNQQCEQSRNIMIDQKLHEKHDEDHLQYDLEHTSYDLSETSSSTSTSTFHSTQSTTTSPSITTPFLTYRCLYNTTPGRLQIRPSSLAFISSIKRRQRWEINYTSIREMRKYHLNQKTQLSSVEKHSFAKHSGEEGVLEIEVGDGTVYGLDLEGERDAVFNYVLGFSGTRWWSLQS